MRGLKGKIAAVTGAASGIGEAAARRLAEEGCKIAILDRNQGGCTAVAQSIAKTGATAIAIASRRRRRGLGRGRLPPGGRGFGRLDILVSNAAVFSAERDGKIDALDQAVWDEILRVNLTGMYLACKHGVRTIKATAKTGAVVCTGSPTGMFGVTPASSAYSSSKGGIFGMARVMAVDYAPDGIRVNVVIPGFTLTPIVAELVADPKVLEWNVKNIPLKRGAQPAEIAAAIAFVASDDASYMTGSFMFVDGGLTAA